MPLNKKIIALFHATGIQNPSVEQIEKTRTLVVGNFDRSPETLKTGIETAENIRRWRDFPEMKFLDTVGSHQNRVAKMVDISQSSVMAVLPTFHVAKTRFMAEYHDMSEGLSPLGDIPTPQKNAMSSEMKLLLNTVEISCLKVLSTLSHPAFDQNTISIESILQEMHDKQTPEAQLVKYFDLLDGFFVSMGEYISGNTRFIKPLDYYMNAFNNIKQGSYLPFVREISTNNNGENSLLDISRFPNSREELQKYDAAPAYIFWKNSILIH